MTPMDLPLELLALLLFMVMGPLGLIPTFDAHTRDRPAPQRRRIALQAAAAAMLAVALAVFLGTSAMARVGTSQAALVIAAGVILVITALRNVFGAGSAPSAAATVPPEALPVWMPALMPIAIPGIVTPVAMAILIIFTSGFPETADRLAIYGTAAAMMLCNLVAMFAARWFMHRIGLSPLLLLGAVFGVLQVALGFEIVLDGLAMTSLVGAPGPGP